MCVHMYATDVFRVFREHTHIGMRICVVRVLPKDIKSTLKCLEVIRFDAYCQGNPPSFSLCLPLGHAGSQHQCALLWHLRVVNHALPQPLLLAIGIVPIYFFPITQTYRTQTGHLIALYVRSKQRDLSCAAQLSRHPQWNNFKGCLKK